MTATSPSPTGTPRIDELKYTGWRMKSSSIPSMSYRWHTSSMISSLRRRTSWWTKSWAVTYNFRSGNIPVRSTRNWGWFLFQWVIQRYHMLSCTSFMRNDANASIPLAWQKSTTTCRGQCPASISVLRFEIMGPIRGPGWAWAGPKTGWTLLS